MLLPVDAMVTVRPGQFDDRFQVQRTIIHVSSKLVVVLVLGTQRGEVSSYIPVPIHVLNLVEQKVSTVHYAMQDHSY